MGDEGEETFDLVEPGGIGGREVNVPTRTAGEPSLDLGMLVGGVVVDDEMDVELGRHIGLDVTQGRRGTPDDDGAVCIGR